MSPEFTHISCGIWNHAFDDVFRRDATRHNAGQGVVTALLVHIKVGFGDGVQSRQGCLGVQPLDTCGKHRQSPLGKDFHLAV